MTHYLVVTPPYETIISIGLGDGTGPSEWGSDICNVEAQNARQAKVLAVREWRSKQNCWLQDQLTDNRNPFAGLKAYNMDLDDKEFNRRYHTEKE